VRPGAGAVDDDRTARKRQRRRHRRERFSREHGPELFDLAGKKGRSIAFEAAVAGGIPIVAAISECLAANRIESIRGILNGTSNFILSADGGRCG